jgi:hypothetical protein
MNKVLPDDDRSDSITHIKNLENQEWDGFIEFAEAGLAEYLSTTLLRTLLVNLLINMISQ